MIQSSYPGSVWARDGCALVGSGPSLRYDPGTGPRRYRRALNKLRESGRDIALASFTFDPDAAGSIIDIPEDLIETSGESLSVPNTALPRGRIVVDGVDAWRSGMGGALEAIKSDVVEKVVLSRQVDIEFDSEVPVKGVIDRLHTTEPDCFTFHVDGLVGASPELLVSLQHGRISSLALAGTALDAESLTSEKMDREHALSLSSVEEGILPYTTSLNVAGRTVLNFGDIKHLATRFEGVAVSGTTVLDILASLHPTAAVAGSPADTSVKVIKDLEPRSRGRYAGPVGWFNVDGEGEFAIALRCGLIRGAKATLFAGGGIVLGSDLDSELTETELKLRPMLKALGLQ